jgi:DNA-binding CsgD family transcriptional regulator
LIDSGVTARLLDRLATTERTATPVQPIEPLTDREQEGSITVARGRTSGEIALNITSARARSSST